MDFKAGMFIYALVFLLGVVSLQQFSALPETSYPVYAIAAVLVCLWLSQLRNNASKSPALWLQVRLTLFLILLFLIGITYASFYAKAHLSYRLDESLAGQDILLHGQVSTIPVVNAKVQRFEFEVNKFAVVEKQGTQFPVIKTTSPKKVRLSWYYGDEIKAGEQWQLVVRLKPPHGFINPGGFDYEAWLFQQHIDATGYIRKSTFNKRLQAASSRSIHAIRQTLSESINKLARNFLADDLIEARPDSMALVKALAIGDKSSISTEQWEVLKNTGTSHLMAISGLHIGLAAMFMYALIRRSLPEYVMKRLPAQHVAIIGGMGVALLYALVAGFSIPTQRAVIMLLVLSVMLLIRRNHRPLDALGLALVVVLLIDSLAVLSAGFWFSFSAVAVIFISVSKTDRRLDSESSRGSRWLSIVKQWLRLQFLISLFLLPLSLFMFQQASLVSPLANLLLIPYVSFLVVPAVLLAIVCSFVSQPLSNLLFQLAANLLDIVWPVLTSLSELPHAFWIKGDVDIVALLFATSALLMLYYSRKINHHKMRWGSRISSFILLVPLFLTASPSLHPGEFVITVLDVGQGSAAVIQTKNHTAVFDAGAKFSDSMDAGSSAVVPYLRHRGKNKLDLLIISHGDSDHIGGAESIIESYPAAAIMGQDIENLTGSSKRECNTGFKWHWDGVDFEFLSPAAKALIPLEKEKRNNHSCVLRLTSAFGSALFTGDIESRVERGLLGNTAEKLSADVLIVPHHGSKTSSSQAFLEAVNPKYSTISVGYKNRYRLPNSEVIRRYMALKLPLLRTDVSGAITLRFTRGADIAVEKHRERSRRYWHHNLN